MESKKVLEILIPAIELIDGGCSHCISRFIDHANELLENAGISLQYQHRPDDPDDPERDGEEVILKEIGT